MAKTSGRPETGQSRQETMAMLGTQGLRAALIVWLVVNAVNLLQSVGFATRPFAPEVNPVLGLVIAALAIPATWALLVFRRRRAGWLFLAGPLAFDVFVLFFFPVEHLVRVQWRDPLVPALAVPYLGLFFGSIVLMGLPMYRLDRRRWLVTVTTSVILLGSMLYAMSMGVGQVTEETRVRWYLEFTDYPGNDARVRRRRPTRPTPPRPPLGFTTWSRTESGAGRSGRSRLAAPALAR